MPEFHTIGAFVAAAILLLVMPGPTDTLVVSYVLTRGRRSALAGVHGETRTLVGVLLFLADTTSGGGYTLSGNDYCAPSTPPTAALSATPTTGSAPLMVAFNASASSDPDAGDSVEPEQAHPRGSAASSIACMSASEKPK